MTQQTNPFQQLVRRIHETYHGTSGSVHESALEPEPDGTGREVDVLVTTDVGGTPCKIAIECRDRKRPDDIQWVDSAVGKYADLEVDKIVLVSRRGFSKAAVSKAVRRGIALHTLDEASAEDWPASIAKVFCVPYVERSAIAIEYTPKEPISLAGLSWVTAEVSDEAQVSMRAHAEWRRVRARDAAKIDALRPTLRELSTVIETTFDVPPVLPNGVHFLLNGNPIELGRIQLHVRMQATPLPAAYSRYLLRGVGVAAAAPLQAITEVTCSNGGTPMRFTVVEDGDGARVQARSEA